RPVAPSRTQTALSSHAPQRSSLTAPAGWHTASITCSRKDTPPLLHGLVRVDAPDLVALEPALDALRLDAAPRAAAFDEARHDSGLGTCHRRRRGIGFGMEDAHGALDQHIARTRQHALMHPTLAALEIADLAPHVEFLDDLHRQPLADEHPVDGIALARAGAQVDFVGPQG